MRDSDAAFEALRDAIEEFALQRAPEVVAEASAEATARVRSMLSDAMAHALLDHARGHVGPGGAAPLPRRQPQAPAPARATP